MISVRQSHLVSRISTQGKILMENGEQNEVFYLSFVFKKFPNVYCKNADDAPKSLVNTDEDIVSHLAQSYIAISLMLHHPIKWFSKETAVTATTV